ncbi:MAG: hypothetical protein BGO68_05990 [Candidatus Amoebophilus sp. 36-38]|nr:MAG: hypothetical protein BGO68_05990 [Candidatus Amoebophilus sp. 36-38]
MNYSLFTYNRWQFRFLYGFLLFFALQIGSCKCEPNKKKPLASFSELKLGGLRMEVAPTELVGQQHGLSVKFIPTNEQIVFLDRYKLTVQVEDRAGVINWPSRIRERRDPNLMKIEHKLLASFSLLKELNPQNSYDNTLIIDLQLEPGMGSRQIVIKFKLYDHENRLVQEDAVTWRIKHREPIPVPEDDIDPTAVVHRKINFTSEDEKIAAEILRRQREQEDQEAAEAAAAAEAERVEQEIRKKRGEEWLGGEGARCWQAQEENWKRMREEKAKEATR